MLKQKEFSMILITISKQFLKNHEIKVKLFLNHLKRVEFFPNNIYINHLKNYILGSLENDKENIFLLNIHNLVFSLDIDLNEELPSITPKLVEELY